MSCRCPIQPDYCVDEPVTEIDCWECPTCRISMTAVDLGIVLRHKDRQRQRGDRSGDRAALEAEKGLATERVEAWLVDELRHQRDVARRLAAQWRNRARSGGVDGEYLPFPWEEGG